MPVAILWATALAALGKASGLRYGNVLLLNPDRDANTAVVKLLESIDHGRLGTMVHLHQWS